eukprot:TRINITY_DN71308_c0_g1_i1.p2 TRINITY_DN71308_c0_g1~~TRINITY_DN71308_c0_g1_i1.p2  ORF type:complete len:365 (+),score=50.39 TRINITY_DN71308_c0_g1_i1:205-1299(+)
MSTISSSGVPGILKRLERKVTIVGALDDLRSLLDSYEPDCIEPSESRSSTVNHSGDDFNILAPEVWAAVARAAVVLRTRHTAPEPWSAGLAVFKAAQRVAAGQHRQREAAEWVAAAETAVGRCTAATVDPAHSATPLSHAAGSTQIAGAVGLAGRGSRGHEGFVPPMPPADSNRDPAPPDMPADRGMEFVAGERAPEQAPAEMRWAEAVATIQAVLSGATATAGATEAANAAAEAATAAGESPIAEPEDDPVVQIAELLEALEMESGGRTAAAARAAVDDLVLVRAPPGGVSCAVCLETIPEGQRAKRLPCGHCFDDGCIETWLRTQHTCPLCRHRLPTDPRPSDLAATARRIREGAPPGGMFA